MNMHTVQAQDVAVKGNCNTLLGFPWLPIFVLLPCWETSALIAMLSGFCFLPSSLLC